MKRILVPLLLANLLGVDPAKAGCTAWFVEGNQVAVASDRPIVGGSYCSTIEYSDQTEQKCGDLQESQTLMTGIPVEREVTHLIAVVRSRSTPQGEMEAACTATRDRSTVFWTPEVVAAFMAFLLTTLSLAIGALLRGAFEQRRALNEWRRDYLALLDGGLSTAQQHEPPLTDAYFRGGWQTRWQRKKVMNVLSQELQRRNLEAGSPLESKTLAQLTEKLRSVI